MTQPNEALKTVYVAVAKDDKDGVPFCVFTERERAENYLKNALPVLCELVDEEYYSKPENFHVIASSSYMAYCMIEINNGVDYSENASYCDYIDLDGNYNSAW